MREYARQENDGSYIARPGQTVPIDTNKDGLYIQTEVQLVFVDKKLKSPATTGVSSTITGSVSTSIVSLAERNITLNYVAGGTLLSAICQRNAPSRALSPTTKSNSVGGGAAPTTSSATNQTSQADKSASVTATPSAGGNSDGINSGTAAGIGVGAAIGGILLASFILCLWFRRSKQKRPRYDTEIPLKRSPSYGENKAPGLSQVTAIGTWNSSAEKHLPQPPADDNISGEMSKLRSLINNHVQSYYRTSEIDLDTIDQMAVAALIENPQISISALASSIADPKSRTPALRYLIASAVFSRVGLRSHPTTSFLPPEVSGCLESMTGLQDNGQARASLLSKWRTITAVMLQPTYGSKTITKDDPRVHNIGQALEELDSVLVRLRSRRDENSQRRRNLEEILKRAAGFAFLLFSHPSFWEFDWQTTHTYEPGSVVIFPALLQVTDESGQRHSRPRTFEEAEVAPLLIS